MVNIGRGNSRQPPRPAHAGLSGQSVHPAVVGAEVAGAEPCIGLPHPLQQFTRIIKIDVPHGSVEAIFAIAVIRGRIQDSPLSFVPLHQFHEPPEQIMGVVGTGRSLGVVLYREDGEFFVLHPLNGLVVQVLVGQLADMTQ